MKNISSGDFSLSYLEEDGEPFDNKVTITHYCDGKWKEVRSYQAI